ncbi:MAG: ISL3 family transposase [Nitrospirota bacterium]|nr:ISL3 family transposase [Nitrospirota bacterium]
MHNEIFEAALGLKTPWFVQDVDCDVDGKTLSLHINFLVGSHFAYPGVDGTHPVHDTQCKRYRHLNFFQHECYLEVRVPRLRLPDGRVVLLDPEWAGHLSGFTLLFEALIVILARQMPFAAVGRLVGESWHRVQAICAKYVHLAVEAADLSDVEMVAIDETSCQRGHTYLTLVADAAQRKVLLVTEGRDATTLEAFAQHLRTHGGQVDQITSASLDMSPAFIKGVTAALPEARITFDKFHIIAHASTAVDQMRRLEQKTDPTLKGLRWTLRKDRAKLSVRQRADLDALLAQLTTKRTARAWQYREQLREILSRKQIHVVSAMLRQWCTQVMRSKVTPMKAVARMIRQHFAGIVAWVQTRQTNGFLEAINGLFQAAKRKARGYTRFTTMRTVIFLIAGKLDFTIFNAHAT